MNTLQKRTYALLCALLLSCAVILGGCLPAQQPEQATTAAPFEIETVPAYEAYDEKQLAEQQRFDRFTEDLFLSEVQSSQITLHYQLKNPGALGIQQAEHLYPDISEAGYAASLKEFKELQNQGNSFDLALLTDDQKLTLRILKSYLDTEAMADGLELYERPLAPLIGEQAQLPILLSEYEFRTRQDAEDYLNLIAGIDEYYTQLLDQAKRQAEAGLMINDTAIDHVIESCESYLLVPGNNFMIDTFNERLETLSDLSEEEKTTLRQRNEELLETDFVPAYQLLIDGMQALKGTGVTDGGLSHLPDGKAYYRYLVYSGTGTSYNSIEDLTAAMENQLTQDLKEVSALLKAHPDLAQQFDSYSFRESEPAAIMEDLKTLISSDFPALPQCSYTLKYVPKALELSLSPAFYLVSPIDDYQNNTIYINGNPDYTGNDLYTTVAHEGLPGHLYQNVYFRSRNTSHLRQLLSFSGYSEGWATYVEDYISTMDNGLPPEFSRLYAANKMAAMGIQACLDVYINYDGWSLEQVTKYLESYYTDPTEVAREIYDSMIENPSNFLSYYVGYMEFHNMKTLAQEKLKDRFDPKEFHQFLLDLGPAPFDVIQPYFTSWLLQKQV